METIIILLVGVLVSVATYLLLSKNVIRVVLGTALLSHAVHLLLLTMGGLKRGSVPILGDQPETYTDALPQALILTAIVISFAVTAFFLVLVFRTYQQTNTDNLHELKGADNE
ncbi:Na(+)/H(+) antiporter subunit C [Domibacillus enclensis]|uniref:Multisubunit sodium/proton antiporter, MrpC subunit n=1 Tax=Domibacillus enclensis TaxID=1017273 RepID=A0A1N6STC2_9BACI|nr:Na(+)/H(+) antiporter subunit C [Domibacillus enclensis]OXS79412.1 Na(+)/H(+) antiporter subunit C [Domibacillus enclensis]SIQ44349.1 multisubunit sodium/proton antiporter, MrpC subunit [Domibacillus enclensis]